MIKIIDNFFKSEILEELYQYFHYAGGWQFSFLPSNYVSKSTHNNKIEGKVCDIIKKICKEEPKFVGIGYEAWTNVLDMENNCLNHHVDCDEESEGIEPAKMTAVIYLGDSDEVEGGELALDTNGYNPESQFYKSIYELEKNMDNDWIKIPYKYNRIVLFDSNYPHAILPIKYIKIGQTRIGLTISSWDKKIKVQR